MTIDAFKSRFCYIGELQYVKAAMSDATISKK
ncbi:MAG: hypothetical protein ACI9SQ_000533 [Rubritalea sp.]|jgi:hypothetical protein